MAIIALDLDGVMYNFHGALRQWIHNTHNVPMELMPDPVTWKWDHWGWPESDPAVFRGYCDQAVDEGFLFARGEALDGALEAARAIKDQGHELRIITARGFGTRSVDNTAQWLRENDVPYDTIMFVKRKHHVRFDLLVDDLHDNVQAARDHGQDAVLFTQDWNAHHNDVPRVDSWDEVLELTNEMK